MYTTFYESVHLFALFVSLPNSSLSSNPLEVTMEKSVKCVTCYVIPNARRRASSMWNDYQRHMRVRN